jgi:hypothetical protein
MADDQGQRRVILIWGEPGQGKSHLAKQLSERCDYHVIGLDDAYIEFVKTRYPDFYLKALNLVIAQHYRYMLRVWDHPRGAAEGAMSSWGDWVASLAENATREYPFVAIEGYLLPPVLNTVYQKLVGQATVIVVEVRNRQYFVDGVAKQFEQICGRNDTLGEIK